MISKGGAEMNPMERLMNIVSNIEGGRTFIGLGGRATFTAENRNDHLYIINSRGNEYEVSEALAKTILERYEASSPSDRCKTSNYTDPTWKGCPNRVYSPYVAAIFREIALRMPDTMV